MRFAPLLFLLAAPLHAELLATFQTSQGNVVVALQYDKAPQAVANFITLAQGTRSRIDPTTGALTRTPLYVGEKFFRVVDGLNGDDDFKIAQTGSGNGTATGVPGYTFRDELDSTLTHEPYVLAMANSGYVHTNGSQIYFTGNEAIPGLDGRYTIFGKVIDDGSHTVIDAIIAAGSNGTTINNVTFSRTDPQAVAFDEFNQDLPECLPAPGILSVIPGTAANYQLNQAVKPGTVFQPFRSPDMATWAKSDGIYHGTGLPGFTSVTLDDATLPKAFYNLTMITYPDALAPASLATRVLELIQQDNRTYTFTFDGSGAAGTFSDSQDPGNPLPFVLLDYTKAPYEAAFVIATGSKGTFYVSSALDGQKENHILGRNLLDKFKDGSWSRSIGGLTLTKPVP